jgi:hypothetical protein
MVQQNTQIVGGDVSVTLSAEVGIPDIGKVSSSVEAGVHWEDQTMQSDSMADTVTYPMTITQSSDTDGPLEPQHAVHCTASTFNSKYNAEYTATVRMTMSSGKTFDIKQDGKLASVLYTDSIQDCKTVPIEDVPTDTNAEEGQNIAGSESSSSQPSSPAPSAEATAPPAVLKRAIVFRG